MNVPLSVMHQTLFGSIDAFALLAVPFFIYAGELMGRGSVAQRLESVLEGHAPPDPFASRPEIGEQLRAALR